MLSSNLALAQSEDEQDAIIKVYDSLYREDQIYLNVHFNTIIDAASAFSRDGLSMGFDIGFMRDMPFNKRRNWAVAIGMGYSFNVYNHNLFVGEEDDFETSLFEFLPSDFSRKINRLTTHSLEVPLQLRWRTSTIESYSFWRIYTGVKFTYNYYYRSRLKTSEFEIQQTDIPEFNPARLGITLSVGNGTFNLFVYYGLDKLFDDSARVNDIPVGIRELQVGMAFYLL
ncbi:MAG: porin family protein [Flavobacteriaceae bacterium]|nr:porin family protein [Flavobacteriaceae bacterium]